MIFTKLFLSVGIVVFLAGCASTSSPLIVNNQRLIVIEPPSSLFNCPTVEQLPNPKTLTNAQVANLIINLETNNRICSKNINAIHDYIVFAKANLESRN